MIDNENQKKTSPGRKTLSLNVGVTPKKQQSGNKVSVEVKRKRSGLNRGKDIRHHSNTKYDLERRASKLTDDEFKTRVKALQKAIRNEAITQNELSITKTTFKSASLDVRDDAPRQEISTEQNKVENNKIEEKTPIVEKIQDKKQDVNKKNKINSNDRSNGKNIIDELIKLAPKNQSTNKTEKEPMKSVVFRSEAFVKKNRSTNSTPLAKGVTSAKGDRNRSDNNNKRRNFDKSSKGTERSVSGNKTVQDSRQTRSVAKTKPSDTTRKPQHQKKYEQPVVSTSQRKTQNQPSQKNKFNSDDKFDNFKTKTETGRFNKRDLDRAINEDDNIRQRSVASINRSRQKAKGNTQGNNKKVVREVIIPDSISVGELANRMSVRASEVVKFLLSVGTMATVNQNIDGETAEIVCTSLGHIAKRKSENDFEQELDYSVLDTEENMTSRAPIVAVMGHVDHGKTTLLDTLRKTSVTKKEAGGITQHVAAYQVQTPNGKGITFIDTPGHAAFSKIRERGVNITDIIVLVVAADDGIKEQTIEVIKEAKKNNVPLVVAINKIDKSDINIEKVKSELMQYDILLESFGGDVLSAEISARNNINIDKLLDAILLQAEVLDLKANAERKATCTVLEARVEKGRGIVASVIVNGGTLCVGDVFVAGSTYGKIRTITDCFGKRLKNCKPSVPVEITGFDKSPEPGDILVIVEDIKKAHDISEHRNEIKNRKLAGKLSIKNIDEAILNSDSTQKILNVYVKADVYGSLEAVEEALLAINCPEVKVSIAGKNIGVVSESDVDFAKTSNAIIVCFNVGVSASAKNFIKTYGIKVVTNGVIYHLVNDVISEMEKLLPPVIEEKYTGRAVVKKLFVISKLGTIAGCVVTDGVIKKNNSKIKVLRGDKTMYEGNIKSMKHEKDEIKECGLNHECGILTEDFNGYVEGDVIECYDVITSQRKIR